MGWEKAEGCSDNRAVVSPPTPSDLGFWGGSYAGSKLQP